jgi:non-ribosomal peptide synthetase component F
MTLLAGFDTLLYRYTGQSDILVGTPIANRNHSEIEGLIGFFVNTLVLRSKIKSEQSFSELLQQTRQTCLDAYAHQDIPFEYLVEKLQPERSLSHNPLFQVMMVLQNVKVLATGQSVVPKEYTDSEGKKQKTPGGKDQNYTNFTFEVTPQEAATIALAQNSGKIRAVLRNIEDQKPVALKDVNTRTLLKVEQKNAERRKILSQARIQDIAAEQEVTAKALKDTTGPLMDRTPPIEFIMGGMGSTGSNTGGPSLTSKEGPGAAKPVDGNAAPSSGPDKPAVPGGPSPMTMLQNILTTGSPVPRPLEPPPRPNR